MQPDLVLDPALPPPTTFVALALATLPILLIHALVRSRHAFVRTWILAAVALAFVGLTVTGEGSLRNTDADTCHCMCDHVRVWSLSGTYLIDRMQAQNHSDFRLVVLGCCGAVALGLARTVPRVARRQRGA